MPTITGLQASGSAGSRAVATSSRDASFTTAAALGRSDRTHRLEDGTLMDAGSSAGIRTDSFGLSLRLGAWAGGQA